MDMIAVYPNYLKYSLPTMAAAYVLVRVRRGCLAAA